MLVIPPKLTPLRNIPIADLDNLEDQYGNDLERMRVDHEGLIQKILSEEEELIGGHRQHIDDVVDIVKKDMNLLHQVDQPSSDIEEYVHNLDAILLKKMEMISSVRGQLVNFYKHLKHEESLMKMYS